MLDEQKRDEMFAILCELSDRQFDPLAKNRLRTFLGRPNAEVKDELLGVIDDCVFAAWSSNFEIQAMHTIWLNIGGSEQELAERNQSLGNGPTPEMRARFKWQTH